MVGTRGETDDLFRESHDFVESLPISRLHVFPYSERPGTRALQLDNPVDQAEKHRRTQVMLRLSERKLAEFTAQFLGTVRPVLPEHLRPSHQMGGFTDNYLRVNMPPRPELANRIVNVRLDSIADETEQTINATIIG